MAGTLIQAAQAASQIQNLPLAFPVATTAGTTLACFCLDGSVNGSVLTVADNVNGSWTAGDAVNDSVNGNQFNTFYFKNGAGGAATVTLSCNNSSDFIAIFIAEIGGVATNPLDGHSAQRQTTPGLGTDAVSSGNGTNASTAFMLALSTFSGGSIQGNPNAGTGFTSTSGANITVVGWNFVSTNLARLEWQASVAPGTHPATFTNAVDAGDSFITGMFMFDETGGGGSTASIAWVK